MFVRRRRRRFRVRKVEAKSLQVERVQKARELLVSQVLTKEKEPKEGERTKVR